MGELTALFLDAARRVASIWSRELKALGHTVRLMPPAYVKPSTFLVMEGLLNFHTETLRSLHDVRVALAPPEELRRAWKVKRDCSRRERRDGSRTSRGNAIQVIRCSPATVTSVSLAS